MNKFKNKQVVHKAWSFISLSTNIIAASVIYANFANRMEVLIYGIVIGVLWLLRGAVKVRRDIALNDLSKESVIISYACTFIFSLILACVLCLYTSILSILYLGIIIVVESIVAFFITIKR